MNEAQLVDRIARAIPSFKRGKGRLAGPPPGLRVGIGDDGAVLRAGAATDWVVTTDAFIDGVHFLGEAHPADSVGYKALARATSDILAMGGVPHFFFLTLAIPGGRTGAWLNGFLRGMRRAARELGLGLAGGDTTRSKFVAVTVTVIGEVGRGKAVLRSGAEPGDGVYVSGPLGAAELGWRLVQAGHVGDRSLRRWLRPHFYPQIRVELGHWLARNRVASAMMDVSDGLSTDMARLCRASRVGARLDAAQIPVVGMPALIGRRLKGRAADPLEMALHGGDDYELLFTVPAAKEKKLRAAPGFLTIRRMGEIVSGRKVAIVRRDGEAKELGAGGWDPFRR
jgi:thiamine-monophosphate kinase